MAALVLSCTGDVNDAPRSTIGAALLPSIAAIESYNASQAFDPNCTWGTNCTAGTEIQALETFVRPLTPMGPPEAALYAGTTHWLEVNPAIYPARSAQVLMLTAAAAAAPGGAWTPTATLPPPQFLNACGHPVWAQVNDLLANPTDGVMYASTLPRQDEYAKNHPCEGIHGNVFMYNATGQWIDTQLDDHLRAFYDQSGPSQLPQLPQLPPPPPLMWSTSEVRYLALTPCPARLGGAASRCLMALAGQHNPVHDIGPGTWQVVKGATVWIGSIAAGGAVTWEATPEFLFDGTSPPTNTRGPYAIRLLAAHTYSGGTYVGTGVPFACFGYSGPCRARIFRRSLTGVWSEIDVVPASEDEVRGLATYEHPTTGDKFLWAITHPHGHVLRYRNGAPDGSLDLRSLVPGCLAADRPVQPYQIHLQPAVAGNSPPVLAVASESCRDLSSPATNVARLFIRPLDTCHDWSAESIPAIADGPSFKVGEESIRWIHTSPFDANDLFVGTTDMNSAPNGGTLTARIFRLPNPYAAIPACPP